MASAPCALPGASSGRNDGTVPSHRIARLSEADRGDKVPVAIELHDAGVRAIVVRATNGNVIVARSIGGNSKDTTCRHRILRADPLPFERAVFVEQLKS